MQKVLRATDRAKHQAQRKLLNKISKNNAVQRTLRKREFDMISKDLQSDIRAARIAQREDWLLGPLAPRRDVGSLKDTYGTVSIRRLRGVYIGRKHDYCIVEGDRVAVVEQAFRDYGKIGTVRDVREEAMECTVEGLNLVDVATPKHMLEEDNADRPTQTVEGPIPLHAVRLVYPVRSPETGAFRDVLIKELKRTPSLEQRLGHPERYIVGTEPRSYIPLPEKPKVEHKDHDVDTLRIEVEQRTWTPTLYHAPMPRTVIDELRNKYSVFRDRHDPSYVKGREELVIKIEEDRRKKEEMMITPLQEYHRMKKLEKSQMKEKPLDKETLRMIGEVMARNKGRLIEGNAPSG